MARFTSTVRFGDGTVMWVVYNGFVDQCWPRLYRSKAEADADWDNVRAREDAWAARMAAPPERSEGVEVMPYSESGDGEVMFTSRADRQTLVLTGPLSLDRADEEKSAAGGHQNG